MEDLIKDIVVRAGENEIKIDRASELVIGDLTITPEIMGSINAITRLEFSEDITWAMDMILRFSEDMCSTDDVLEYMRSLSYIKSLFVSLEKSCPDD